MADKKDNDTQDKKPSGWNTISGPMGQPKIQISGSGGGGYKAVKCPGCQ